MMHLLAALPFNYKFSFSFANNHPWLLSIVW